MLESPSPDSSPAFGGPRMTVLSGWESNSRFTDAALNEDSVDLVIMRRLGQEWVQPTPDWPTAAGSAKPGVSYSEAVDVPD